MKTRSFGRVAAIIPCAGAGKRLGGMKKAFLLLHGVPLLAHTLRAFEKSKLVDSVVIAAARDDIGNIRKNIVEKHGFKKVIDIVEGGKERQDSVYSALASLKAKWDVVVVHDGARPLVTEKLIDGVIKAAASSGAAIAATAPKDTIKEISDGMVKKTIPRHTLASVQTPQAFSFEILKNAYERARKKGYCGTDCSFLVEKLGVPVKIVEGSHENIKITTKEDIVFAGCLLKERGGRG